MYILYIMYDCNNHNILYQFGLHVSSDITKIIIF